VDLSERTREALRAGGRLHDAGRYLEAHEAWEVAWKGERGEARALLQGLIHVTTALFHAVVRKRPAGALRLLRSGLSRLDALPEGAAGLELGRFRCEVAAALDAAVRWERGELARFPEELRPRLFPGSAARDG